MKVVQVSDLKENVLKVTPNFEEFLLRCFLESIECCVFVLDISMYVFWCVKNCLLY